MASESDSSDGEWEENGLEDVICICLFCNREDNNTELSLKHISEQHNFDLLPFTEKLGLDFYSSVRLVNYIRKHQPPVTELLKATPPYPWSCDSYMTPVLEDDPLLQLDYEPSKPTQNGLDCEQRLMEAEARTAHCQESLQRALEDLEKMRLAVQNMVGVESAEEVKKCEEDRDHWCNEDSYFASYSHYQIHEEMLKDVVRTETYKYFIEKNWSMFMDKVVLDVGCGTGILSLFAARAGARKVFAVDNSNIAYKAMDIVRENNFDHIITVIKGKIEEITLPVEKVDIIISEWMGYFLLYESMLDSVLYARNKWLEDPSNIFPNKAVLCIQAIADKYEYQNKIRFWEDVCGFKMECMKQEVLIEPRIQNVSDTSCISSSDTIKKFDLGEAHPWDLEFEVGFSLTMRENSTCNAFVGFFDVAFEKAMNPAYMSTGPQSSPTHWKQTVFYLREPFRVHDGDIVKGTFSLRKNSEDTRALVIKINYEVSSLHQDTNRTSNEQTYGMA